MASKMMTTMAVVIVILGMMRMAIVTEAQPNCAQSLIPCAPYLNNATVVPDDDCCNPIRQAVATQLPCLCGLFNDPTLLSNFNVSASAAFRIARACRVTADLSSCNNATSPTSAPPPPGTPGGDNGGADKIAMTGMTTLFLFLVSIALY